MNAIGLKYVGQREEGIMVMLFKSYKTVKITRNHPYRFTSKDKSDTEACNYYKKLHNLGLDIIYQNSDFDVNYDPKHEVREEPLAAETDIQIDPLQSARTSEDEMSSDLNESEVSNDNNVDDSNAEVTSDNSEELIIDKEVIKSMNTAEISEYLEMNFDKDQIKTLINDLGLEISVGRKGIPTLIGEIMDKADSNTLIEYLCR